MNKTDTKTILFALLQQIAPDIDPTTLEMDDNLREELGIDSFDFLQFIVALDETFGIETPEEDYGKITTLNSLVDYIQLMQSQEVD